MSDKNASSRHGACDRCRGQKLRCTGSAKPIPNSSSRFLRNAVPCDRCRRAKVDCYSVRPGPRRAQRSIMITTPPFSEQPSPCLTPRASSIFPPPSSVAASASTSDEQQDGSLFSYSDPHDDLQPPMPDEWITHLHEESMEDAENQGLTTPLMMGQSHSNVCRAAAPGIMHDHKHDHTMPDLVGAAAPEDWNPDHINVDTYPSSNIEPHSSLAPSKVHKLVPLDGGFDSRTDLESRRLCSYPSHTANPTSSSIHDLAKLHEALLREKFRREYTLTHLPNELELTPNQRSIGHTLHHCQRFISILRRIGGSQPQADGGTANNEAIPRGRVSAGYGSARSSSSITTEATSTPALQLPTLFSILFCYTSILASYEEIFLSIVKAVTRPTPAIPATFSGLRIDGFELDGHDALQLECLLNVSYTLLEKVEKLLFGSAVTQEEGGSGGGGSSGGIIRDKLAAGLVDVLVEAGGQDKTAFADGYGGGKSTVFADSCRGDKSKMRVKQLIREIQAALSEIDV